MSPALLYRIASVLLVLFAAGHTLGFRRVDPRWGIDATIGALKGDPVSSAGVHSILLGLLHRVRTLRHRAAGVRGNSGLAARGPAEGHAAELTPCHLGFGSLLRGGHLPELALLLHRAAGLLGRRRRVSPPGRVECCEGLI